MLEKLKTAGKIFGFATTGVVGALGLGMTIAQIINNKVDDDDLEEIEIEIDNEEDEDEDLEVEE